MKQKNSIETETETDLRDEDSIEENARAEPPATWGIADPPSYLNALATLALCLLVAVSLFPATEAGFVWDDSVLMQTQPVQALNGLAQIWFAPRGIEYEAHYWPILYTTFWLEHKLWGFNPLGYHIVSVLLHLAVTLLLWRLMRRLGVPGAWVVAAVFAVHPTHVESAVWVIGRKDLLASLFYIACVLTWMRFTEDGRWWRYALALLLFVLSLLSKAIAVTLPVSLLIWHWWKQGRITAADASRVAPLLVIGLGIIVADWFYYESIEVMSFNYSFVERVLIAAQSLWFYAVNLLWPANLAVIYPHWDIRTDDNPLAWAAVVSAIAVPVVLWFARHKIGRGPLAGVLFFAVTLSPVLGLLDYGYMRYSFVADRYQYLAGIGLIAIVVGVAVYGVARLPNAWRAGASVMTVVLLAVFGTLSWQQAGIYRDSITFYRHIIDINPQAGHAHSNLGLAYQREGRYQEAEAACRTSLQQAVKHPDDKGWNGWVNMCLGEALAGLGRIEEAEKHYRRAVEFRPGFLPALAYLGAFLVNKAGRSEEALEIFSQLSERKPENPDYHAGMGASLANLRRFEEALQSYTRALELDPQREGVRISRERVLRDIKQQGE